MTIRAREGTKGMRMGTFCVCVCVEVDDEQELLSACTVEDWGSPHAIRLDVIASLSTIARHNRILCPPVWRCF